MVSDGHLCLVSHGDDVDGVCLFLVPRRLCEMVNMRPVCASYSAGQEGGFWLVGLLRVCLLWRYELGRVVLLMVALQVILLMKKLCSHFGHCSWRLKLQMPPREDGRARVVQHTSESLCSSTSLFPLCSMWFPPLKFQDTTL